MCWARMALPICDQLFTRMPPMLTIRSPTRTPALLAGDAGSPLTQPEVMLAGTHDSTVPTAVPLLALSRPMPLEPAPFR